MPAPPTHADCPPDDGTPCVHVGCRHNTYLDVEGDTVRILDRFAPADPRRGSGCALRTEPMSAKDIADRWGVTSHYIREIEEEAMHKVRMALGRRARALFERLAEERREDR